MTIAGEVDTSLPATLRRRARELRTENSEQWVRPIDRAADELEARQRAASAPEAEAVAALGRERALIEALQAIRNISYKRTPERLLWIDEIARKALGKDK